MGKRSRISGIYARLRSEGVRGTLSGLYWRAFPPQLECYAQFESFFRSGHGLEIGGPSAIFKRRGLFPIYPVASRIDNCNFSGETLWQGILSEGETFVFDTGKAPGRQYLVEASNLQGIGDSSYDYVLSSHCIEHLANPLKGLAEWVRVLKQNGLVIIVLPHKDGTFDHRRPVTSLEHLIEDYESDTDEGDMTHLGEILRLHDLSRDPGAGDFQAFEKRSRHNVVNRCLHHHVFDTRLAAGVVSHTGLQLLAVELFRPYHIVVVAKKLAQSQLPNNQEFLGVGVPPCWSSPFASDQRRRRRSWHRRRFVP